MGQPQKNQRHKTGGHFAALPRELMETPAWRGLSVYAQALYPWLKLEWRGAKANNNGKISLSVRQAAERMGVGINTAARAFHDLQAKGFLVVTAPARLGLGGEAKSPLYEMTELPLPTSEKPEGRKTYRQWRAGCDFPVHKATAHNPTGRRAKTEPHHSYGDSTVTRLVTK